MSSFDIESRDRYASTPMSSDSPQSPPSPTDTVRPRDEESTASEGSETPDPEVPEIDWRTGKSEEEIKWIEEEIKKAETMYDRIWPVPEREIDEMMGKLLRIQDSIDSFSEELKPLVKEHEVVADRYARLIEAKEKLPGAISLLEAVGDEVFKASIAPVDFRPRNRHNYSVLYHHDMVMLQRIGVFRGSEEWKYFSSNALKAIVKRRGRYYDAQLERAIIGEDPGEVYTFAQTLRESQKADEALGSLSEIWAKSKAEARRSRAPAPAEGDAVVAQPTPEAALGAAEELKEVTQEEATPSAQDSEASVEDGVSASGGSPKPKPGLDAGIKEVAEQVETISLDKGKGLSEEYAHTKARKATVTEVEEEEMPSYAVL
ncbi:hypothetical protein DFP72DRAFT_889298, partial [Ephemerocybe angulata]